MHTSRIARFLANILAKIRARWRLWLVIFALSLLGFGWWWLNRPKPLVLVSRYRLARVMTKDFFYYRALDEGALWQDDQRIVHAVRWDGTPLWTMNPLAISDNFDPKRAIDGFGGVVVDYFVSPDLRWVVMPQQSDMGELMQLRFWHDGQYRGDVTLPVKEQTNEFQCSIIDNAGSIWCRTNTQLLRIKNARVIARGTLPTPADYYFLSHDGESLAVLAPTKWTYYTVHISGSAVRFNLAFSVKEPDMANNGCLFYFLSHDALLLEDGRRYNAHGQVAGDDEWKYNWASERFRPFTGVLAQNKDSESRVLNFATGQYWTIPEKDEEVLDMTPNGRYVLTYHSASQKDEDQTSLIKRWPWLERFIGHPKSKNNISIYERPGRLCTRSSSIGLIISIFDTVLSPDGHTLHTLAKLENEKGEEYLEILEYHW